MTGRPLPLEVFAAHSVDPCDIVTAADAGATEALARIVAAGRPAWMAQAACRGADPELFHPRRGGRPRTGEALALCGRCPVLAPCREWALADETLEGTAGGMTSTARAAHRRAAAARTRARTRTTGGQ